MKAAAALAPARVRTPKRRRARRANITVAEFEAMVGNAALAQRLMREMDGRRPPRMTDRRVSRETRDAQIRADLDAGHTYAETAERNQVSEFTVWRAAQRP